MEKKMTFERAAIEIEKVIRSFGGALISIEELKDWSNKDLEKKTGDVHEKQS